MAFVLVIGLLVLFVGTYFFVFGFSRGSKLAKVFLIEFNSSDRQQFMDFFQPKPGMVTIDGVKSNIEVNMGVIVAVDRAKKVMWVVTSKGLQWFKPSSDGSFFFYSPFCVRQSDTPLIPVAYSNFDTWVMVLG